MIEIRELKEADKGRKVIYNNGHGGNEEGVLTSWNDNFVFARFKGPTGEACRPVDLSFAMGPKS